MKDKIIKGVIEFFLIVFSVLLAFYFEGVRQKASEKRELILKLKELRHSLGVDSSEYANKLQFLARADSFVHVELKQIIQKQNVKVILAGMRNSTFYYPIKNWSLQKILEGESFDQLSNNLKETLYSYNFDRDFPYEAVENEMYKKDKEMDQFISEKLKYSVTLLSSQNVSYKISDSTVLYSDELKSFLVKKIDQIDWVRGAINNLPQTAHQTAVQVDKEVMELQ